MSTLKSTFSLSLLLLVSACSHPRSAAEIAAAGGLTNAEQKAQAKTKSGGAALPPSSSVVVGTISWVNSTESIGAMQVTAPSVLPPGTVLVVRDNAMNPISLVQTTQTSSGRYEGLFLIAGTPLTGQEVVLPGPEYKPLIEQNLNQNDNRAAAQAFQAAGTADPLVIPGQ